MVKREIASIKDMLNKSGEMFKNRPAYEVNNQVVTYNEFIEKVNALGTSLIDMGLKGKRIAIIGPNSFNWEMAYLAIVCGTGVVVPLDKSLPRNEMESLIKRSEINAIFFDEKYTKDIVEISQKDDNGLEILISMGEKDSNDDTFKNEFENSRFFSQNELIENGATLLKNGKRDFIDAKIDNEVVNILLFTSGTTSKSKAVMLSHKNICANLMAISDRLKLNETDIFLSILPLHHVFECTVGFLYPLYIGAKIVFGRGLKHIAEDMKIHNITILTSVPAIYEKMYKNIRKKFAKDGKIKFLEKLENNAENLSMEERRKVFKPIHEMIDEHTKILISGAAALDPEVEKGFRIWGFNLVQGYGLTETSPVIAIGAEDNYRLSSIGRPLNGIEARIVDKNQEGIGELIVKGDNIMLGYYNEPEETEKVIKDGWFYTGDLAKIDEDGYVYICGRKKSVIVLKNGKNIFPEEMEKLINKIDGVKESFIFGKITNKTKDDIKLNVAIVYDKEEVKNMYNINTTDEIYNKFHEKIKEVNKIMPSYKAIRGVVFSEEPLIKTSTNKIKRNENLERINTFLL